MTLLKGMHYCFDGFTMISQKGLRRFVLIPLLINVLLFGTALIFLYDWLTQGFDTLLTHLPSWLGWLEWILWPLAILAVLFSYSLFFSIVTNFIAAPFNGLLAERVEQRLTNQTVIEDSWLDTLKDIPRMIGREWTKLCYYLPKAILFFCLLWLLPVVGQIIWVLFISWMYCVQYNDYPFDNHKIPFDKMRASLKQQQGLCYGFGLTVFVLTAIPFVNLIVMPVAVCGATKLWVEQYRSSHTTV